MNCFILVMFFIDFGRLFHYRATNVVNCVGILIQWKLISARFFDVQCCNINED